MILETIIGHKLKELEFDKKSVPLSTLHSQINSLPSTKGFKDAISNIGEMNLIAEVKKKSPSKGIIRSDFDPVRIAETYAEFGAAAISILTDVRFFDGKLEYLSSIREVVNVPLLRKDFTIDPYHIFQARAAGADAILLIVAALTSDQLHEYIELASSLTMDAVVEVHTEEELDIALDVGAEIIGINNRNLKTFQTDLDTTFKLLEFIPEDTIVISESGILSRDDVRKLEQVGLNAILVGESLMRSPEIGEQIIKLMGKT
ncbi:indole-3-glycerol phosphate synthase TrpC [Candidatus Poribacteria bacterium]|nr:indole-3-glycerol phosphate synthase TrpC [Candidatus Poribacteria bacterium]